MANRNVHIDPDATLGDLLRRLGDDGKRLMQDEVRLAKLEIGESIETAGRGMLWLGVALGFAIIALTALTVGSIAAIGRVATDSLWLGALLTAVLWLIIGGLMVRSGIAAVQRPGYTLPQTRQELALTREAIARADGR